MENLSFKHKMINTFKRYGYVILFGVFILAILTTLIVVGVSGSKKKSSVTKPTSSTTIVSPCMPVLNATIYKEFSADKLLYNSTLKQWEYHNAVDFQVASGSSVYSILDGVVTDVYTNTLEGTVVVVSHNDGLESTYGSLSDVDVVVGDRVNRGDEIGVVSTSATAESDAGSHLHFSLTDNGKNSQTTGRN